MFYHDLATPNQSGPQVFCLPCPPPPPPLSPALNFITTRVFCTQYILSSVYDRLQNRSICKSAIKVVTVEHIHDHLYTKFLHFQLTKGVQKSVNPDTRGKNVKIYCKLSTVMGVTWFLGFGAAHSTIVAYLYIIINSLQGKNLSKRRILKLDAVMPFIDLSLRVKFCIRIKTHFCIH